MDSCSGAITSPWRFQGRILESASGSTDLYDFSARAYDPSLGAFTSFDSVSGSAQNPLTLNRYLYALANPARFVDPSGHEVEDCTIVNGKMVCKPASQTVQTKPLSSLLGIWPKGGPGGEGKCSIGNCGTDYVKFRSQQKHNAAPDCNHNYLCNINNILGTIGSYLFDKPEWCKTLEKKLGCASLVEGVTLGIPRAVAAEPAITCLLGGIETGGLACAPLIGQGVYVAINGTANLVGSGGDPSTIFNGLNWVDLATAGLAGLAAELLPAGVAAAGAGGFTLGFVSDVVSQEYNHPFTIPSIAHAACVGAAGGVAAATAASDIKMAGKAIKDWLEPGERAAAYNTGTGAAQNVGCNMVH